MLQEHCGSVRSNRFVGEAKHRRGGGFTAPRPVEAARWRPLRVEEDENVKGLVVAAP